MIELNVLFGKHEGKHLFKEAYDLETFLDQSYGMCKVQGWAANDKGQIIRPCNNLILAEFTIIKTQ